MKNPNADVTDTYHPNPKVLAALTAPEPWHLVCNGHDLFASAKFHKGFEDRVVYQALTQVGSTWVRLRGTVYRDHPYVDFAAWAIDGDTRTSKPLFLRHTLHVQSRGAGPIVSVYLDNAEEGTILQGQGRTIRQFRCNLEDGDTQVVHNEPFETTPYAPRSPNQTGGNWAYMGLTHPPIEPRLLYPVGGYAGFFQKPDGELLTEADMPDLQAGSHIHAHSKDPGWIHYNDPGAPWRDRMAFFGSNQDGQHSCLFSAVAQQSMREPKNQALKMLLEAYVHVYTRSYPSKPRGTSHANPGAERSQGRVLKEGAHVFEALLEDAPKHAAIIGKRVGERWENQVQQFVRNYDSHDFGFAGFARTGMYSANEIGIHWWGLEAVHRVIEKIGAPHLEQLHWLQREASTWLFESFRFYDIPGDRGWGHPYFEAADHSTPNTGPTSSSHFAWLGATRHEPRNPTEVEKMKHILELGESMDARFKG